MFSGLRYDNWKVVFMEQRVARHVPGLWTEPFTPLRVPKLFNLRTDPYERADVTSNTYFGWIIENPISCSSGDFIATDFLESFKEFPPRQEAARFTIDHADGKDARLPSRGIGVVMPDFLERHPDASGDRVLCLVGHD